MSNYNPYTASASAAITELTSDRAKQYYAIRAQQDTQMVIDATLTAGIAVYEAAVLAYQMGAFVRAWIEATEQAAIECTAIVPAISTEIALTQKPEILAVEESITYQLAPAAAALTVALVANTETWILSAIRDEVLKPWEAKATHQESAPLTKALVAQIEETNAAGKAKTAAKKRTPKANAKTATPAKRKSPTRVTVGNLTLSID
jgi:hypothetical protein